MEDRPNISAAAKRKLLGESIKALLANGQQIAALEVTPQGGFRLSTSLQEPTRDEASVDWVTLAG